VSHQEYGAGCVTRASRFLIGLATCSATRDGICAANMACDLIARGLDTPGTLDVAALAYGTPLRDAGPVIREMLGELGFPVAEPDASDAEQFATVLRVVGTG
jgi:hypothetical protein